MKVQVRHDARLHIVLTADEAEALASLLAGASGDTLQKLCRQLEYALAGHERRFNRT